ncbi:hypothetical protein FQR65_LT11879 [Abscondita terminalis]|nr:hypothetical protein FQR65_LT11879 [Abscondita terminalis]
MKLFFVAFLTTLFVTVTPSCTGHSSENKPGTDYGYYWRDYVGHIPPDAVEGGLDKSGNPTYIGQVYTKQYELLPATIYSGCPFAVASAYNHRFEVDKNIKILCSNEQDKLAWVLTKNEETHLLFNCHMVIGGFEVGQTLNIGRVNHGGHTIIGKVFSYPLGNRGLWIPNNAHEANFLQYEILTYGCPKKIEVDVRSE